MDFEQKIKILELEIKNLRSAISTYENRLIALELKINKPKKNATRRSKRNNRQV